MVILKQVGRWRWVVLAGIILVAIFMLTKSCGSDSEGEYWKGMYDSEKETSDAESVILLSDIDTLQKEKEESREKIDALLDNRDEDKGQITLLITQLETLKKEEPSQPELESEPLVINLRAQIKKMSLAFADQAKVIAGHDQFILDLTKEYDEKSIKELKITEKYQRLYEMEQGLHSLAVKRLSVTENRIRGLRFGHQLKNAGFVIVIGTLIYVIAN